MRFFWIIIPLFFIGCLSYNIPEMVAVSPISWDDVARVTIANSDTVSLRDVDIIIRHNSNFVGDSLLLSVVTTTPDSIVFREVLMINMPNAMAPSVVSNEIVVGYRRDVLFDKTGEYTMEFTPATEVEGVKAVGVNIVYKNNN